MFFFKLEWNKVCVCVFVWRVHFLRMQCNRVGKQKSIAITLYTTYGAYDDRYNYHTHNECKEKEEKLSSVIIFCHFFFLYYYIVNIFFVEPDSFAIFAFHSISFWYVCVLVFGAFFSVSLSVYHVPWYHIVHQPINFNMCEIA